MAAIHCVHSTTRPGHSWCYLSVWMQSISKSHMGMVHLVYSGNQNQSRPGAIPAAAGAEEEAGGQTGTGAKPAAGAEKGEAGVLC